MTWRWRWRLDGSIYRLKNASDCQQLPEARRRARGFSFRGSRRHWFCWCLDLRLVASRTTREQFLLFSSTKFVLAATGNEYTLFFFWQPVLVYLGDYNKTTRDWVAYKQQWSISQFGGWKSKIRVPALSGSGEGFLGGRLITSLCNLISGRS